MSTGLKSILAIITQWTYFCDIMISLLQIILVLLHRVHSYFIAFRVDKLSHESKLT